MESKRKSKDYMDKVAVYNHLQEKNRITWSIISCANTPYNIGDSAFHGDSFVILGRVGKDKIYMADMKKENDLKRSLVCASLADFKENPFPDDANVFSKSRGQIVRVKDGKLVRETEQNDFDRAKNIASVTNKPLSGKNPDLQERWIHLKIKNILISTISRSAMEHGITKSLEEYYMVLALLVNSANYSYTGKKCMFSGENFVYKHKNYLGAFEKEQERTL